MDCAHRCGQGPCADISSQRMSLQTCAYHSGPPATGLRSPPPQKCWEECWEKAECRGLLGAVLGGHLEKQRNSTAPSSPPSTPLFPRSLPGTLPALLGDSGFLSPVAGGPEYAKQALTIQDEESEDAMGGWKKEGGGKPHECHPLPKRGFGRPLVRYVFHPPQVSVLCSACTKLHDSRPEAKKRKTDQTRRSF